MYFAQTAQLLKRFLAHTAIAPYLGIYHHDHVYGVYIGNCISNILCSEILALESIY